LERYWASSTSEEEGIVFAMSNTVLSITRYSVCQTLVLQSNAMPETTVDVDALYAALDNKRKAHGTSWREVARQLDVSPSTFSRMAQGRRPDVDTFATLLRWLGMPAESFMRGTPATAGAEEPVAMVSSYLRSARNVKPEDAEALEDIFRAAYNRLVREP
jgi:transcriptional regulator with XRE-family HTH domain